MCGRYSITTAPEAMRRLLGFVNEGNREQRRGCTILAICPPIPGWGGAGGGSYSGPV